jgi:hypothetical protein
MLAVRAREDRGRTKIGWLDSRHSFSFGDYFDEDNMGYRSLRVINEDVVSPGAGVVGVVSPGSAVVGVVYIAVRRNFLSLIASV